MFGVVSAVAVLGAGQPPASMPSKPWLIAHRGASAYAPENTVPAFQLAADPLSSMFMEEAGTATLQFRTDCNYSAALVQPAY